jgi:hypothetical protein
MMTPMLKPCCILMAVALAAFPGCSFGFMSDHPTRVARGNGDRDHVTLLAGKPLRSIDDPELNTRWLLLRDAANPGAPARMVEAPTASSYDGATDIPGGCTRASAAGCQPRPWRAPGARSNKGAAISSGQEILLLSKDSSSQIALHAKALSAGRVGDEITALLDVFHTKVHVRVLSEGRAEMLQTAQAHGRQP